MRWLGSGCRGSSWTASRPTAECTANRPACHGVRRRPRGTPRSASSRGSMSSSGWSCDALVEPAAADDAQARAVRPAQRRDRLGQLDRLADRASRGRARDGRSGGRRRARRRSAAAGRWPGPGPAGTPPRGGGRPGSVISRRQRLHSRREGRLEVGRGRGSRGSCAGAGPGRRSARPESRSSPRSMRDAGDLGMPFRAGLVGQQPGDVPGERAVARWPAVTARVLDGSAASSSQRSASPPPVPSAASSAASAARRSSSRAMPFLML